MPLDTATVDVQETYPIDGDTFSNPLAAIRKYVRTVPQATTEEEQRAKASLGLSLDTSGRERAHYWDQKRQARAIIRLGPHTSPEEPSSPPYKPCVIGFEMNTDGVTSQPTFGERVWRVTETSTETGDAVDSLVFQRKHRPFGVTVEFDKGTRNGTSWDRTYSLAEPDRVLAWRVGTLESTRSGNLGETFLDRWRAVGKRFDLADLARVASIAQSLTVS